MTHCSISCHVMSEPIANWLSMEVAPFTLYPGLLMLRNLQGPLSKSLSKDG